MSEPSDPPEPEHSSDLEALADNSQPPGPSPGGVDLDETERRTLTDYLDDLFDVVTDRGAATNFFRSVIGALALAVGFLVGLGALGFAAWTLQESLAFSLREGLYSNVEVLERLLYAKAVIGAGALGFAALLVSTGRRMMLPLWYTLQLKEQEMAIRALRRGPVSSVREAAGAVKGAADKVTDAFSGSD